MRQEARLTVTQAGVLVPWLRGPLPNSSRTLTWEEWVHLQEVASLGVPQGQHHMWSPRPGPPSPGVQPCPPSACYPRLLSCVARAEMSGYDRHHMAGKDENLYFLAFCRKFASPHKMILPSPTSLASHPAILLTVRHT